MEFFLRNILIGFAIAAPVGPVGLFCINRSLKYGWIAGVCAGLGAAFADTLCGAIAGTGSTAVMPFLNAHARWLHTWGGVVLLLFGLGLFFKRPKVHCADISAKGMLTCFGTTFILTLLNPATILSFAAIFVGLGVNDTDTHLGAMRLLAGIFIGSMLWWCTLSCGVGFFRRLLSLEVQVWFNRIAGVAMMLVAAGLIIKELLK